MPRGGRRLGAGRPLTGEAPREVRIEVKAEPEQAATLRAAAAHAGETVSDFLLTAGLDRAAVVVRQPAAVRPRRRWPGHEP
jgi:uncharacterized protein (DUF1778 family)